MTTRMEIVGRVSGRPSRLNADINWANIGFLAACWRFAGGLTALWVIIRLLGFAVNQPQPRRRT